MVAIGLALALTVSAQAADPLKLGFVTTLSGATGAVGNEAQRGFDIALQQLGGQIGGRDISVVLVDDKGSAAEAVEIATRLVERDKVDLVMGLANSAVLMAGSKRLLASGKIVVGAYAGPSPFAGAGCHPNAFFTNFQNDQWAEGMGAYLNAKGVKRLALMALDYQAGWDHLAGIKRTFKGEIVSEVLTPFTQLDFAAEFAQLRPKKPDALFVFYVGGPAVSFVKQFTQAGLNTQIPLYSLDALTDPLTLPALGASGLGIVSTATWNPELDNPANKRFVAAFKAKYGRVPASYAQAHYDAVMLLDGAIRQRGGDISDTDAFRQALREARFDSVRGPFAFNNNHMPIQNVYVQQVVAGADGKPYVKLIGIAAEKASDSYHQDCPLK
nr:ABC transporter substrate-binding protein [Chelatococcus asaccharovorans]